MGDVKTYLRKMDFPDVVPEALGHMQKLWLPDGTTQQLSLLKELSQEFVFFEIDQWGTVREQKLTPIKELQVLERIAWFFREKGPDSRLATFIFLFPYGSPILDKRLHILNKLVSMAIAVGNSNILNYVGTWMQLNGCHSQNSLYLAKSVRQEYFKPNRPVSRIMNEWLPKASPLFCASLTIALATLYLTDSPPVHLVEAILTWIQLTPSYCFDPLKIRIPSAFNFPGPQTPLPEIMRWTILSPFYETDCESDSAKKDLFSALNFYFLEVMISATKVKEILTWEAISKEKIQEVVDTLKKIPSPSPEKMEESLARLAQCLEVGLTYHCIHPNEKLADLFVQCIKLPYHKLLKIILQKWSHELESGRAGIEKVTL